jgi:hypothetical protein
MGLKDQLITMEKGRFAALINSCSGTNDVCEKCYYFNPNITDPGQGYRCNVSGSCPAATIHPNLQSFMWMKLGWINEDQHHDNLKVPKAES